MLNIGKMMKQVQDMQGKMAAMQAKLADTEMVGQAGGGAVSATLNGKGEMLKLKIAQSLVDAGDGEMIEDAVLAAFRDAKAKIDALVAEETEKAMGGLQLPPGMQLPF